MRKRRMSLDQVIRTLESGKRPRGGARPGGDGVPSLGAGQLKHDGEIDLDHVPIISREFFRAMRRGIVRPRDILVVKDGATTGRTAFVGPGFPAEAAINEHLFIIRTDERFVLPEYLHFHLCSVQGQALIARSYRGSAQGGINRSFVRDYVFDLPDVAQQRTAVRHIGLCLQRLRQARRFREQAAKSAALILQAFRTEQFDRASRFPARPLGSLVRRVRGGTPDRQVERYFTGDIPWITVSDVPELPELPELPVLHTSRSLVTAEAVASARLRIIGAGSVVVATRVRVGKVAVAGRPLVTNQDFSGLVPGPEVDGRYLGHFLLVRRPFLRAHARGGTIRGISVRLLDSLEVPLPPLCEQLRIVAELEQAADRLDRIQRMQQSTARLLAGLRDAVFRQAL